MGKHDICITIYLFFPYIKRFYKHRKILGKFIITIIFTVTYEIYKTSHRSAIFFRVNSAWNADFSRDINLIIELTRIFNF